MRTTFLPRFHVRRPRVTRQSVQNSGVRTLVLRVLINCHLRTYHCHNHLIVRGQRSGPHGAVFFGDMTTDTKRKSKRGTTGSHAKFGGNARLRTIVLRYDICLPNCYIRRRFQYMGDDRSKKFCAISSNLPRNIIVVKVYTCRILRLTSELNRVVTSNVLHSCVRCVFGPPRAKVSKWCLFLFIDNLSIISASFRYHYGNFRIYRR